MDICCHILKDGGFAVLNRFLECSDEIQAFLYEISKHDLGHNYNEKYLRISFLKDIINHYNHFKLRRQWNYHEEWKSYSSNLVLLEVVVKTKVFDFFPLLKRQHKT